MPLKVYKPKGSVFYHYRGTIAGRRLRGATGTTDKVRAERIAAEKETEQWQCHLDGPAAVLTFAKAAILYRNAGNQIKFLPKIEDYWKDTLVKKINAGAIRQSAIDIYPSAGEATRNRQVITPTQAVINHCADLELCPPIRVRRFKFETKIKQPITVEWLNAFFAHARPITAALAGLMFATACRISQARRVAWADIDFKERTVKMRDSKTKKERLPNIPPRLVVALANLPRDERPFPYSESQLRRFWDEDIASAGIERLTFHSCRHGFATKMLRDGKDAKTAAALGGWSDISLFMNTYAHAIEDRRLTDGIFDIGDQPDGRGGTAAMTRRTPHE